MESEVYFTSRGRAVLVRGGGPSPLDHLLNAHRHVDQGIVVVSPFAPGLIPCREVAHQPARYVITIFFVCGIKSHQIRGISSARNMMRKEECLSTLSLVRRWRWLLHLTGDRRGAMHSTCLGEPVLVICGARLHQTRVRHNHRHQHQQQQSRATAQ